MKKYLPSITEAVAVAHEVTAVPGGNAEKMGVTVCDVDIKELLVGIYVEFEHSDDIRKAVDIALDHLAENPKYYTEHVKSGLVDEDMALKLAKILLGV